ESSRSRHELEPARIDGRAFGQCAHPAAEVVRARAESFSVERQLRHAFGTGAATGPTPVRRFEAERREELLLRPVLHTAAGDVLEDQPEKEEVRGIALEARPRRIDEVGLAEPREHILTRKRLVAALAEEPCV